MGVTTGKKSRRGRLLRWLAVIVLLLLGAGATLYFTQEPLLMVRAIKAADTRDWDFRWTTYHWISSHEVLLFKEDAPGHSHGDGWNFYRRDLATHQERYLGALSEFAKRSYGKHSQLGISPDGRRIFWTGDEPGIFCCTLEGTKKVQFPQGRWSQVAWMGDSNHLVEYVMNQNIDHIAYGLVHDIRAPATPRKLPVHALFAPRYHRASLSTKDRVLFTSPTGEDGALEMDSLDVFETSIGKENLPPDRYHVRLPFKANIWGMQFSPQGDRIVWPLLQDTDTRPPFLQWLSRHLPALPLEPRLKMSLWTSRIDGSRMHEIGYVPLKPSEFSGFALEDVPDHVSWLPDGKRVSFVLKDALYTVPAD